MSVGLLAGLARLAFDLLPLFREHWTWPSMQVESKKPRGLKPIYFSKKRFETLKKKYTPYKNIYDKNKRYEDFANWYFERNLLGFSHSNELKNVFGSQS